MAIKELDPISRIEGHLGADLDVNGGVVDACKMHGNLFRGFENFLIGREPNDAITFTQRICGVCPVPHGLASTHAVEAAMGYSGTAQFQTPSATGNPANIGVPDKAIHIRNLVLGAEFLMSSMTHFYHLAAPSYIQGPSIPPWTPHFNEQYYHPALQGSGKGVAGATVAVPAPYNAHGILPADDKGFSKDVWSAVIKQYVKALRIRRLTFEAGALFAGRMPMTSCFVAGGTSNLKSELLTAKCSKFSEFMKEIGDFVVKEYIPVVLALGYLYRDFDNKHNTDGKGWGAGCTNFLSWGGFQKVGPAAANGVSSNHFVRGYVFNAGGYYGATTSGTITAADVQNDLTEDTKYSWYAQDASFGYDAATGVSKPYTVSRTKPSRSKAGAYSYLKAPRFKGQPCEVGPLARLVVQGLYAVNGGAPANLVDGGGNALQQLAFNVYAKVHANTGTGLNPNAIEADLAVALVRAGLAELWLYENLQAHTGLPGTLFYKVVSGGGIGGGDGSTEALAVTLGIEDTALTNTVIGVAYGLPSAVIQGPIRDWIVGLKLGLSTMDRIRARALESLLLLTWMYGTPDTTAAITWNTAGTWLTALPLLGMGNTYRYVASPTPESPGIGAVEAPRGALMHICTIKNKKIERYQCIVPTTWNASPKSNDGKHGPMEQAVAPVNLTGPQITKTAYAAHGGDLYKLPNRNVKTTTGGGVEALRIAQSFDPCIACAVH